MDVARSKRVIILDPSAGRSANIRTMNDRSTLDNMFWDCCAIEADFDGKQLLSLVRSGNNPFHGVWDVNLLIREIEENLSTQVIDIPIIYKGSNNYGFHLKLSNRPDIVARLARGDVNMPDYGGFPVHVQVLEVKFEAAVYELLRSEPNILASRLLLPPYPSAAR